ncbi:transcriptional activator RfaH [Roseobacter sp. HKCCD9010]|uniref:transcription termination/antitermination protein NusG n=1 Tax=unclassified Roseobacter TaxID=196798 RepID=UPI001493130D|nr:MULTISPECIES: transcriptional activator RfaH [unclassified Roseobacter]MBF9050466.1 transcriptional activator RfaH [Rhodobacterales bacterium HKCCD4356]NNV12117.1 transcriptional activator RfaH [Roseobacter sp. HKCCD7357]NNV17131.1 transcriptional activator RfaH [Roseobacter sp. HKCCD8768]NNV26360.1 transcriptional activator RfaH [Roseobacter sp. HKCCD8192]NNV30855.1 transcriptional activator RfaH [Roseobacter sp. HKCCD9061]
MSFHDRGATWFLAQLKPNSVKIAERNLERQGFRTFLPVEEVTKRAKSRFLTTKRPVFPGYIFVSFDISVGGWRAINSTNGITRLVSFGRDPAPVPPDIVSGLILRCDALGELMPSKLLSSGDRVVMTHGPFANFVAEVEQIEPDHRIWILLNIMGGKTRATIDAGQVRSI